MRSRLREATPVAQRVGGQLRAVVTADERWRRLALADEAVEHGHRVVSVDPLAALDRQRLPGELIHNVQELQDPPIGSLVELKSIAPHDLAALLAGAGAGTVELPGLRPCAAGQAL
jgi:hypothetical protein